MTSALGASGLPRIRDIVTGALVAFHSTCTRAARVQHANVKKTSGRAAVRAHER
jgi:hypothetical protein